MIGERLTKLRKEKGLTQDALGEQLSLTKFSISMYENNKNTPTEETLIELAKLFNVSIDYLAGLIDEPCSYQKNNDYVLRVSYSVPDLIRETISNYVDFINQKYTT